MKSYSERHFFAPPLIDLLEVAREFVEQVEWTGDELRCHELTRAVGRFLGLPADCVQDGYYGFADHSWLWVPGPPTDVITQRVGWPDILDVYCVGRLPQVQLVLGKNPSLPHVGWAYRPDKARTDIKTHIVDQLVQLRSQ